MNPTRRIFLLRGLSLVAGAVLGGTLAGCGNIFIPKHKVTVDAICAAGVAKPAGLSFRLVAKRSSLGQTPVKIDVLSACVGAALAHAGMFEAPAIAPPDLLIEVNCGQERAPRGVDPTARETYLELSARTNKGKAMEMSREPEIWNVRVSIQGLTSRLEQALPLLSAVAASYTASDTRFQTLIEVPQNNASIAAVRDAAVKTLEARGSGTPPPAAPTPASSAVK
ncbi:MAG: hypothetical protein NTV51_08315 [Verrucomicrobia bacterium]|nr:hypothetical protein [Verrucomicrobiota bacterium]